MKTAEILEQLNTEQLKTKVTGYPMLIFEQKKVARAARETCKDAEQERAAQEAILIADISAEPNPTTGKPMFSNAEARQAELLKRKRFTQDYLDAEFAAKRVEMELNQAQDKLDMLFDEYKSACFVAELVTAEVNLWAGELDRDLKAMFETGVKPAA
jgi:hypothetical protein